MANPTIPSSHSEIDAARRSPSRRSLFSSGAVLALLSVAGASAGAATMPPAVAVHPDQHLLRLGADLDAAWAKERAAWADAKGDLEDDDPQIRRANQCLQVCSDIVGQIQDEHALTLDGLLVKVRALAWCRENDPVTAFDLVPYGQTATVDTHIVVGLLRDLSAMGSV